MELRNVGSSGLRVSSVALGTLTWSRDTSAEEAGTQLDMFLKAGGTLIDTAASYARGGSEELIGSLLGATVSRKEVHLCSKAGIRRGEDGGVVDASRLNMLATLDASLKRLNTDYLDLWLVHTHDPNTPLDETLHALEIAVNSGRARYVGVSNFPAWAIAAAATLMTGPTKIVASEVEYSLLQRSVELEIIPAAKNYDLGVLAWSPLGRGVLTGKYRNHIPADSRAASEHLAGFVQPYLNGISAGIVEALIIAAEGLGRSASEVALAWVLQQPQVASAIVGARTTEQLAATIEAAELSLPAEIISALDEVTQVEIDYPY